MTTDGSAAANNTPPRLLRWLERLPKVAIFVAVLVITVGFLWTPGITGALLTTVLAAGAAFLLYATWPQRVSVSARLVRVLVVLAITVLGIVKFFV